MSIKWLSSRSTRGVVTLSRHYMLLNVTALSNLTNAFKILVGINDENNVVIKGIKRDEIDKFAKDNLISFKKTNSYLRIASTDLINEITESLKISTKSLPRKYYCVYKEKDDYLLVNMSSPIK